jgi:uncharacterized protein (UPF0371 family)
LLGASSAALLNALKALAGIPDDITMIAPAVIEPISRLKVDALGGRNPRLHTDETLIALAISAVTSDVAAKGLAQLSKLEKCEMHSSVILSQVDSDMARKLGMNLTCEPEYETKQLYHK